MIRVASGTAPRLNIIPTAWKKVMAGSCTVLPDSPHLITATQDLRPGLRLFRPAGSKKQLSVASSPVPQVRPSVGLTWDHKTVVSSQFGAWPTPSAGPGFSDMGAPSFSPAFAGGSYQPQPEGRHNRSPARQCWATIVTPFG